MDKWPDPRPIKEAPKGEPGAAAERIYILAWMWERWHTARWDHDEYAKKPRPFWTALDLTVSMSRTHQPEWWLPMPPPIKRET
jgi:hypothetical protein